MRPAKFLPLLFGVLAAGFTSAGCTCNAHPAPPSVSRGDFAESSSNRAREVPLGLGQGLGFDDLVYSSEMGKTIAPAGRSNCVALLDPNSLAASNICSGRAEATAYSGGHDSGLTSADFGAGMVFAVDRSNRAVLALHPSTGEVVASAKLAGSPDYVRWIRKTEDVWVTEPDAESIEVFHWSSGSAPQLIRRRAIQVSGGPESLVVDQDSAVAYSHLWKGRTLALDAQTYAITDTWENGCQGSRGIALDSERHYLFFGCAEGQVGVLDLQHAGRRLGTARCSPRVDLVSVNLRLGHLYAPAASDGTLCIFEVSPHGQLTKLGTLSAVRGAHCVANDERGGVWVCDPARGSLLHFRDPYPPAPR
ncbi:MAG TPA: hypothetical protein VFQ61_24615 [Polyangiaceae bacterium]|nr:hypothetical protein [Polyangiaceae bacterium]